MAEQELIVVANGSPYGRSFKVLEVPPYARRLEKPDWAKGADRPDLGPAYWVSPCLCEDRHSKWIY